MMFAHGAWKLVGSQSVLECSLDSNSSRVTGCSLVMYGSKTCRTLGYPPYAALQIQATTCPNQAKCTRARVSIGSQHTGTTEENCNCTSTAMRVEEAACGGDLCPQPTLIVADLPLPGPHTLCSWQHPHPHRQFWSNLSFILRKLTDRSE
jgi:hypothetical protein